MFISLNQQLSTSQFRGIETSDAGRYICAAVNSAGTTRAVAEVVVNGQSQVISN